jgi:hypothetical protein
VNKQLSRKKENEGKTKRRKNEVNRDIEIRRKVKGDKEKQARIKTEEKLRNEEKVAWSYEGKLSSVAQVRGFEAGLKALLPFLLLGETFSCDFSSIYFLILR